MSKLGRPLQDLDGQRFGKLIATNKSKCINARSYRQCHCDCGKTVWIRTGDLLRTRYTKSCGCRRHSSKLDEGKAARNAVLYDYKRHAFERQLTWRLTEPEFDALVSSTCYFCGGNPRSIKRSKNHNGDFTYNGIDRLDNKRGYTIKNVVSCCIICNRAKREMPLADFLNWIKALKRFKR